eukprot:COSAG05_NODE_28370_length_126_cov_64.407407_1_plen_30_part_01
MAPWMLTDLPKVSKKRYATPPLSPLLLPFI